MTEDESTEMHLKSSDWLETETVKAIRKFQRARTQEERDAAEKRIEELKGRLFMQTKELARLMGRDV